MTALDHSFAEAAASAYEFSRVASVVDVGGNQGTLLAAILRKHPAVRGVLFDLPHVVSTAKDRLAAAGVEHRCTITGGDFFTAVPPGGDVYILSYVLHDWDDERCVAIMNHCRSAMSDGGKLLIVEAVLPEGDEPFFGKWVDLHMLVMASGRERTLDEYRKLLQAGGFNFTRTIPLAVGSSIVEATPA
jgi:hypothetical protein